MLNWLRICKNISKIFLVALNGFCTLLSLGTMIFALVDTQVLKQYGEGQATGTFIGDVIIIAACLLLIGVAAFGTVGVVKENAKILYMYVGYLLILVVLQVFIAVYVAVHRFGLQFKVAEWLREDFYHNVTEDDTEQHRKLWDQLQISYECCGLNGPEDYQVMLKPISLSCCQKAYQAKSELTQRHLYRYCIETCSYYTVGCEEEILFLLRSDAEWLVSVAVISLWLECCESQITSCFTRSYLASNASMMPFLLWMCMGGGDCLQSGGLAAGIMLAMYVANNVKLQVKLYQLPLRF